MISDVIVIAMKEAIAPRDERIAVLESRLAERETKNVSLGVNNMRAQLDAMGQRIEDLATEVKLPALGTREGSGDAVTLDAAMVEAGRLVDAQIQRIEDGHVLRMIEAGCSPEEV